GASWLEKLRRYIRQNMEEAVGMINADVKGVRAWLPEGTYLIWADASELIRRAGLTDDRELARLLEDEGRVKFTPGSAFGNGGGGFLRINTACPRSQLMEGLERLKLWAQER
ncbi:hypothetical protein LJC14_07200, partial [Treponema sp. OttesenSCG-928-L16]|nr:hypothetical protein [Treponema sp. OttesenSCG-928-L16]